MLLNTHTPSITANSTSTAIARTVVQWFLYCLRFPLAVVEMQQGPSYVPMQNAA